MYNTKHVFMCLFMLQLVYEALHLKPGGAEIFREYNQTNGLSDQTRRKLDNILAADMMESNG